MKAIHVIQLCGALACCSLAHAENRPVILPFGPAAPVAGNTQEGIPIAKPAEFMKLAKVQPGLYTLRCAGMDKAAANSYGPYLSEAPTPARVASMPRCGCSSVVNGDFVGRNQDSYMMPAPYFMVWTDAGKDHYASLAMAPPPVELLNLLASAMAMKDDIAAYSIPAALAKLTTLTLDGVNEKGVCCTVHVLNPTDGGNTAKGTNPGAEDLSMFMVCRYVLDHAATASEAIELLKKRNIRMMNPDVLLHWVIADPQHSYIVEVVGDQLRYTDKKKVLTNYQATIPGINPHPWGFERARLLEEHYGEGISVKGMYNLMRRVRYTQAYSLETKPYWYSEHMCVKNNGTDISIQTPLYDPELRKTMEDRDIWLKEATPENNPHMLWETSYGNVYDMRNKTMRIMLHEKYDTFYDAKL